MDQTDAVVVMICKVRVCVNIDTHKYCIMNMQSGSFRIQVTRTALAPERLRKRELTEISRTKWRGSHYPLSRKWTSHPAHKKIPHWKRGKQATWPMAISEGSRNVKAGE
ncbi:hypothetical protein KIL84_012973 [Mauremys mutica]|uniref:Uncharacterized protein n=1 Tax=Mauremys mutica TaxID=74926 RepID=A0A9D3XS40_9SAUR|nr:hypothetical protein KIL84_012973 [Mauremys mutica]